MYKVLLVDDEKKVLDGLQKHIQWTKYGFEVSHTATTGTKALELIDREHFDLMITDIKMPDMTGLEVLEAVRKNNNSMEIGILSGHSEFDYAKEAMRNGACTYLTKPLDFVEMYELLSHLKKKLDEKEESSQRYHQFVIDKGIFNMIHNEPMLNHDKLSQSYTWLLEESRKQILRIQLPTITNEFPKKKLEEVLSAEFGANGFVIASKRRFEWVIVGLRDLTDSYKLSIEEALLELIEGSQGFIGVSSIRSVDFKLGQLFHEADEAVRQHFFKRAPIVYYEEIAKTSIFNEFIDKEHEKGLLRDLSIYNHTNFVKRIDNKYESLRQEGYTLAMLSGYCVGVFEVIRTFIFGRDDYNEIQSKIYSSVRKVLLINLVDQLLDVFVDEINQLFEVFCQEDKTKADVIDMAKTYINDNYNSDIGLNEVADKVYIHPIYLSRLFKERTGDNYINYLTKVRMKHAKELMQDKSLKMYQISEMVGYESSKYFSRIFKEHTGKSPREYRRSLGGFS